MKKIKSCIFLILTVLFSASVFAFDAIPPDKGCLEAIKSTVVLNQGEIFDLDTNVDLATAQATKEDETVFSKVLSVNRGTKKEFSFLVSEINQFAVVQNQNFDRMYRF